MVTLFFTWPVILRRYEGMVAELAAAGHEVVIASPARKHRPLPKALGLLPGVRGVGYAEVSDENRGRTLGLLRNARDYLWYLTPEQESASFNRRQALDRMVRRATEGAVGSEPAWPDPVIRPGEGARRLLDESLAALDAAIPADPGIVEMIRREKPDVVIVSPLLKQLDHQAEALKAARALQIPTAFLVYSWDNLSNKGRVHVQPDRTLVWNELQQREAVELHGLDPESVSIVGAPHWDRFFAMEPSLDRDEFCARHGFDPSAPVILYLGSTTRICPDEPAVVDGWLDAVRGAGGLPASANVLVRPHPDEKSRWRTWQPRHERVSLNPRPSQQDQTLYDELHHSSLAVGLNTSAQIEASIVGRPVYTFAAGDAAPGQGGTLHFYYLLADYGGVVTYAASLEEHIADLTAGLAGEYDAAAIRRFCELFVRPRGLDRPVVPLLAEEIVALAQHSAAAVS